MNDIDTAFFRIEPLLTMVVIGGFMETIRVMFPELDTRKIWHRLKRLVPLLLGMLTAFLPGVALENMLLGPKAMFGVVLGMASGVVYDIILKTIIGKVSRAAPASIDEPKT